MRCVTLLRSFLLGTSLLFATALPAHENTDQRVLLEPLQQTVFQAGKITLAFELFDQTQKRNLSDADLNIVHEKRLHFFIFDPALQEYRHEHPTFDGKNWTLDVSLLKNGKYWLYAQGEITSDGEEFTSSNRMIITGGAPANAIIPLKDARVGVDGISRLTLPAKKIKANSTEMISLTMDRTDGTTAEITPYLGALAHVVITPDDGDMLIHAHPHIMGGQLMIHAEFPAPGMYRVWTQFLDAGILRTIPLAIKVE